MNLLLGTILVILAGLAVMAVVEWHDDPPKLWVVKVRLWLHRRNRR